MSPKNYLRIEVLQLNKNKVHNKGRYNPKKGKCEISDFNWRYINY